MNIFIVKELEYILESICLFIDLVYTSVPGVQVYSDGSDVAL